MVSVLPAYFRTPRVQIAALVYFLIAGSLTQLPLFNYLGYEFSALMTIPAAFISGTLAILFMREHRLKPLTRRTWLYVFVDYILVNFLLLLIPLVVITLNAFVVKNCAYGKGVMYYFLLPVCTMIFSIPLAVNIGIFARKAIFIFYLTVILILAHILFITYTQPQLFAYNFILGFFPGITYDETLSDITPLILFRQFTIIASLMLISFFVILTASYDKKDTLSHNFKFIKRNLPKDKVLWGVVLVCLLLVSIGHLFRDSMGFEYSEQDIQNRLGRQTESSHFVFYYNNDDYTADDMRLIKAESEFHYRKVAEVLKTKSIFNKKISVYIFPNIEWKQRFIGTSNTNIAKPWKSEIHLTKSSLETTFRHELVHVLAAEFGFPVINASTRMGLNEGLAVAVDWDEGMFTPHQYAAALRRENGLTNAEILFTYTGFAVQSSSYAYLVSGSFVRYLIDRFGIDRFRHVFPNGNFVYSFGESLESLVKDWNAYLKTVDDSGISSETVRTLFFQSSIFYKTCAREVAEQNKRALQAIRIKDYTQAMSEFNASYENAPTAYALRGIFQSLNSLRKPKEVIKRYTELKGSSSLKTNPAIMLLLADAYFMDHQHENAKTVYRIIRAMNYSESFSEATAVRNQFLQDKIDPTIFFTLYYSGINDSLKITCIDSVMNRNGNALALIYVKGMLQDKKYPDRVNAFNRVAAESSSTDLQYFASLRIADQLFLRQQFEEAKSYYWQAKNHAPTIVLSDRLDEKIALCEFIPMEME